SGSKVGGGFFMLGWWFHMSTAISVRVWFLSSTSRARLPTWHSVQPLEENSFSPGSDGGKEKFLATLRVSGRFCRQTSMSVSSCPVSLPQASFFLENSARILGPWFHICWARIIGSASDSHLATGGAAGSFA